jgi:uncharacterized integral membrane protein
MKHTPASNPYYEWQFAAGFCSLMLQFAAYSIVYSMIVGNKPDFSGLIVCFIALCQFFMYEVPKLRTMEFEIWPVVWKWWLQPCLLACFGAAVYGSLRYVFGDP